MEMSRSVLLIMVCVFTVAAAINRSVYKIELSQKGFTQFVQYDVETPPIREFTFCTWIRVYDLENDQSIFTYIVNGNNRIVRLWLVSGGRHMQVSFSKQVSSSILVNMERDVWRHVCLSYQSDYGAWALYMDSQLVTCEAAHTLNGFVIPAGGSVIVGYGTSDNGLPTGLEGEIFGVNMILSSTIERNFTMKSHPQFVQKSFRKNKIRGLKNIDYVVLKDLKTEEINNIIGEPILPPFINKSKNFIKISTPSSFVEHNVGKASSSKLKLHDASHEKEILDIVRDHRPNAVSYKSPMSFWNLVNEAGHAGKFKAPVIFRPEPFNSETQDRLMISEFETPPPVSTTNKYSEKNMEIDKPPVSESIYKVNEEHTAPPYKITTIQFQMDEIPDVEVPPPQDSDTKVYGQWTSSRYAGSVLNYLKSINFNNKEKKVPKTIPLMKGSDSFPYPSELKTTVIRPPSNLQRKKNISEKRFHNQYIQPSSLKRLHIEKRNALSPEINVEILENDFRSEILRMHAQTKPQQVEITNRGETKPRKDNRLYRNTDNISLEDDRRIEKLQPNELTTMSYGNYEPISHLNFHKTNSLFNVLPFLKSVEYFTGEKEDFESNKAINTHDMYTKSFSNANKWHNIKSYSNDYTPRRTPFTDKGKTDIDQKIAEANKIHPSIRLKYKPENKFVHNNNHAAIMKGREMAIDVSNQSNHNEDSISILRYNHGYLPYHHKRSKSSNIDDIKFSPKFNRTNGKNNFNKHVKIGNALNERHIIGVNAEQNKQSFIGGDEKIPDIHRYRSDIDNDTEHVPSSLKPRACKNVELFDNILFIQPDGSIDMTHILSPLKPKNVGIEFIIQNYQKCPLEESYLEKNYFLLINWSKTPVRLFGGATPVKTKDLCGFF